MKIPSRKTILPSEMKQLEQRFMEQHGVPGALLMEHAAQGVVEAIRRYAVENAPVIFLCGPGNNGGDGYAAARLWAAQGGCSTIIELTDNVRGSALLNRNLALLTDGVTFMPPASPELPDGCVIVDALYGTGLDRDIFGEASRLIQYANAIGRPIVAVDIPSGLDGKDGHVWSDVIHATETVTFHRIKQGLLLGYGPCCTGRITVHPILIPMDSSPDNAFDGLTVLEPAALDCAPCGLHEGEPLYRAPNVHKGDMGRVALLCGSRGMAGAAALCANAAMRAGAGLTTILCRESLLPILQTLAPGATCTVLPERDGLLTPEAAGIVRDALERADAACIGCGLGQSADVLPLLRVFRDAPCPVVWDADALNLLSRMDPLLPLKEADVITPHIGEAARLLDEDRDELLEDPLAALDRLHELCGCTVLLKGPRTLITDGLTTCCNRWGTPAMAKGGSGDVLSGVITALLARSQPTLQEGRLDSVQAAALGALIHGLAGLRAEKSRGVNCVNPTDLIEHIRLDSDGF